MAKTFIKCLSETIAKAGLTAKVDTLCGNGGIVAVVPGKPVIHITALEALNNAEPSRMQALVNSRVAIAYG